MRFLQLIFLILSSTLILAGYATEDNIVKFEKDHHERIPNEQKFMPFMCRSQAASRSKQQIRLKLTRGLFEDCGMTIQHKRGEIGKKLYIIKSYLGEEDEAVKPLTELIKKLDSIENSIKGMKENPFGHYNVEQIKELRDKNFFSQLYYYEQKVRDVYKSVVRRLDEFKHKANEVISEVRMGNPDAIKGTKKELIKMRDDIIDQGRLNGDKEVLYMWVHLVKKEFEIIRQVLEAIEEVPNVDNKNIKIINKYLESIEQEERSKTKTNDLLVIDRMKMVHKKLNGLDNGDLKDTMAQIWYSHLNKMISARNEKIKKKNKNETSRLSTRPQKFVVNQLLNIQRDLKSCLDGNVLGKCKIHQTASRGMRYFGKNGRCVNIYILLDDEKMPDCIS